MTAQSMHTPSSLFAWAVRVLYTWNWNGDKTLPERIVANPEQEQRIWVITKAVLLMLFQAGMWIAAIGMLIGRPYYLGYMGRGGLYLASVMMVSLAFLAWCVYELWVYTRRYSDDFSTAGHEKFLRGWPDWVRYVMPSVYDSNMPRICAVAFMIAASALWWLQGIAQDWDLQYLTRTKHACSVEKVEMALQHPLVLRAHFQCADGQQYTTDKEWVGPLVWNDRSAVQCFTYERGLLWCSRK